MRKPRTHVNTAQLTLEEQGVHGGAAEEASVLPSPTGTPRTARGILRIVEPVERDDVFVEIGLGDPKGRKVESLKSDILRDAQELEETYRPKDQRDRSIYELLEAVLIVAGTVGSSDAKAEASLLKKAMFASGAEQGRPVQKAGMRDIHSLGLLKNAFQFLPFKNSLSLYSDDNNEQKELIKNVYPSKIWEDTYLSLLTLRIISRTFSGLDTIYGFGRQGAREGSLSPAVEFVGGLQDKIDSVVICYKRSDTGKAKKTGRETFMRNLNREAWGDLDYLFSPDKPPADHSHSA